MCSILKSLPFKAAYRKNKNKCNIWKTKIYREKYIYELFLTLDAILFIFFGIENIVYDFF